MDTVNSLRNESRGHHNGSSFGIGTSFGNRAAGFGKLPLAAVPNVGDLQHISQALGSGGGGGAAGFGGKGE